MDHLAKERLPRRSPLSFLKLSLRSSLMAAKEHINWGQELHSSIMAALWMTLLTAPMMVCKINTSDGTLIYRWHLLVYVAVGAFFVSALWRLALARRDFMRKSKADSESAEPAHRGPDKTWVDVFMASKHRNYFIAPVFLILLSLPLWSSPYVVTISITALIYTTLGLGLNIVVGVSGLLNLGYVAFYAIGAYTYALLNHYFGWGLWVCLPLGAMTATITGLLLGFPVLRLRGDYLAIVTLGFGEIVRLVLVNMSDITMGPRGISQISAPGFFGLDLNAKLKPILTKLPFFNPGMDMNKAFILVIMLTILVITILAVFRLENSRLGRAWLALREDEIACQAMGIDRTKAKLTAFALGATWAGLAGVVFASQVTFINPSSFTFMQSVMILSIVVLGGMGSIPGVIVGALVLTILPESLRNFSDYRMLIFGALMVLMMVFRPGGLIQSVREFYVYKKPDGQNIGGTEKLGGDLK